MPGEKAEFKELLDKNMGGAQPSLLRSMHLLAAVLLAVLLQCADAENLCDVDKRRDVIFLVRR